MNESEELLEAETAAALLGVSVADLSRLRRRGELAAVRVGWRRFRYRRADIAAHAANSGDTPAAVRMANAILVQAINASASDIHLEPDRNRLRVRFRMDGVLREEMTLPKHVEGHVTRRLEIMADLNVAAGRAPQAGMVPIQHGGKDYEVRVVSVPSLHGHALVLRIPNAAVAFGGLSKLGFRPDVRTQLEDLADTPSGLLLLAGPVGSGVTTTAFSLLHKINSSEKKIWTLEPRIEYRLGGVEQIAVQGFRGLNVTNALAAVLRADPDIVFVADVRNPQTAQAAVDAAGAVGALARLAEFGISRNVIGRTVTGVCAQRLARRVCTECREAYAVPAGELQWLDLDRQEPATRDAVSRPRLPGVPEHRLQRPRRFVRTAAYQ